MDIQIFLQHLFGFIGICTVINWTHRFVVYRSKPKIENQIQELRSKYECPCCSSPMSPMRSTSLKECTSCDYTEEWKLDEGQLPLVANIVW